MPELHLTVDRNPRRASGGQQRSLLAVDRGLGAALAAVAAGHPCSDNAAFSRARPLLDPRRHSTEEHRCALETAVVRIVGTSVARGTIQHRPEKFRRNEAVL